MRAPFAAFGGTILLSAFLLFQIQPLIAKIILPWFGGSASVWTACLVFFQVALLLGYTYAHLVSTRLRPRVQGLLHIALVIASLAVLPVLPADSWRASVVGDPTTRILLLLLAVVGLPYFLLSTTGPLVQAWFARARPAETPYRLFALSNLGSMLALLSYPIVIEPFFRTHIQAFGWSAGYVMFAGLVVWIARGLVALPDAALERPQRRGERGPGLAAMLAWFVLAACPSVLLLAVTHHLTQNISPIPFLWILPLALYLLSFILCFESDAWYRRRVFPPAMVVLAAVIAWTLADENKNTNAYLLIPLYCAGLFAAAMMCHGELARMRPQPRHLTAFYLMISLGGAAGGVFVGLIAPRVFNGYHELSFGLSACLLIVVVVVYRGTREALPRFQSIGFTVIAGLSALNIALLLAFQSLDIARSSLFMGRNFYGVLRVVDSGFGAAGERALLHGTISHGKQLMAADKRDWPTTYYGPESGIALAIAGTRREHHAQRVGVVGLGTGTLAVYSQPGHRYRFYEINPLVAKIAQTHFRYLARARGATEIVLGDARFTLEREPDQGYDVLAVDAFSSDAIPVHLLTREAVATYFRHLRPGGVLAVHISNRYLDLEPVMLELAAHFGRAAVKVDSEEDRERGVLASTWVLFAETPAALAALGLAGAEEPLTSETRVRLWTDDFSNLFELARFRRG